jgi:hypothetical protein
MIQPMWNEAVEYYARAQQCAAECLDPVWAKDLTTNCTSVINANYSREAEKAAALVVACTRWLNGWETSLRDDHLIADFRMPA